MKSIREIEKEFIDRISYEKLILHYRWICKQREELLKND